MGNFIFFNTRLFLGIVSWYADQSCITSKPNRSFSSLYDLMKKAFYAVPGGLLLIFLLFVGTIPFLVSLLIRIAIRQQWVACLLAFGLTVAVTLYSSAYPETFHFGTTHLRIHDGVRIMGQGTLPASMIVNLVYAWVCRSEPQREEVTEKAN